MGSQTETEGETRFLHQQCFSQEILRPIVPLEIYFAYEFTAPPPHPNEKIVATISETSVSVIYTWVLELNQF